jgi:hypothetical protein
LTGFKNGSFCYIDGYWSSMLMLTIMKMSLSTESALLFVMLLTAATVSNGHKTEKHKLAGQIITGIKILSRNAVLIKSAAFHSLHQAMILHELESQLRTA